MPSSLTARLSTIGRPAWFATLCAGAALAVTIAHWAMLLAAPKPALGPSLQAGGTAPVGDPRAIARLFGGATSGADGAGTASTPQAAPSVPVQVIGLVAAGKRSSALLIVDGKPLRSYAVGDLIAPTVRLRSVGPASVTLEDAGRERVLAAPARTSPSVLGIGAAPPVPQAR